MLSTPRLNPSQREIINRKHNVHYETKRGVNKTKPYLSCTAKACFGPATTHGQHCYAEPSFPHTHSPPRSLASLSSMKALKKLLFQPTGGVAAMTGNKISACSDQVRLRIGSLILDCILACMHTHTHTHTHTQKEHISCSLSHPETSFRIDLCRSAGWAF